MTSSATQSRKPSKRENRSAKRLHNTGIEAFERSTLLFPKLTAKQALAIDKPLPGRRE